MPRLVFENTFRKSYQKSLTRRGQEGTDLALAKLASNPQDPSLHFKQIQPLKVYWEMRSTYSIRVILRREYDAGEEVLVVVDVGEHDIIEHYASRRR